MQIVNVFCTGGAEALIGMADTRWDETIAQRSRQANFKTLLAGIIQSLILKCNMLDTGGTPTFIRRDYLHKLSNAPDDYVFESYVLYIARKLNFRISRPRVEYAERLFGQSHWQRGVTAEINLMRNIVRQSKTWK